MRSPFTLQGFFSQVTGPGPNRIKGRAPRGSTMRWTIRHHPEGETTGMADPAEPGRPPLRRDAELNRRRLLAAAREVFRDRGLTATLDDVARHAGLGVGTAYRHFANKDELVDAVFEDMIDQVEASAREAAADPDPWHGLASSLEKVCELQADDRGLREVMLGTGKAAQRQTLVDRRVKPLVDPLIARAKEQGTLRADAEPLDLPMIQLMVAAVTDRTGE